MGAGWLLREYSTPLPRWEKNISFLLLAMQVSSACSELIGREKKPNNPPRLEGRAGVYRARAQAARADGTMRRLLQTLCLLLLLPSHHGAVITGACERDPQCGSGTCCAVSLWLRGLRMCTPLGQEGDECHPFSHKVPFLGKRQHHTCPCLPNFSCSRFLDGRYRCSLDFKNFDF
ncbi:prokineticin-1 [Meleagris gallopavo]|uniref:Prokineticin-1 n=2 Tax=Phasianidae TaxID=9005 RepID=A0A803YMC0_MELGA|nr:prokineticin-1 [Meleagris gallopavo]